MAGRELLSPPLRICTPPQFIVIDSSLAGRKNQSNPQSKENPSIQPTLTSLDPSCVCVFFSLTKKKPNANTTTDLRVLSPPTTNPLFLSSCACVTPHQNQTTPSTSLFFFSSSLALLLDVSLLLFKAIRHDFPTHWNSERRKIKKETGYLCA